MSAWLRRVRLGHYVVEVGDASVGRILYSSWTGEWQAYTVRGDPVGIPHRARGEAARELLRRD